MEYGITDQTFDPCVKPVNIMENNDFVLANLVALRDSDSNIKPGDVRFQLAQRPIPRTDGEPFANAIAARFLFVVDSGDIALELTRDRAVVFGHVIEPKTPEEAREVFDGFKAFLHACFNQA
jgi:hypothetical protein